MERLDHEGIREQLARKTGREYWRSLDELAGSDEFVAWLKAEFPRQAETLEHVDRRQFLKLMGASLALAGLGACTTQPPEKVVPYVKPPEELVPGEPVYFATAMPLRGTLTGLLVESHVGRPTKVEGNPQHPASLGASDAFAQASVLELYDPDRAQVVRRVDEILSWEAFAAALDTAMKAQAERGGAGLRILTQTVSSPTLSAQIAEVQRKYPAARWHQYEPLARDSVVAGARLAFAEDVTTYYRFDQADVVVALDADFLSSGVAHVRYARDFVSKRRLSGGARDMNRLYVAEPTPSNTGVKADQRLAVRASAVPVVARALAAGVGVAVSSVDAGEAAAWVAAAVADLQAHRGRGIVIAGDQQPAEVHALAHAMNAALGNAGKTVVYTEPVEARPELQRDSLAALVKDMRAGSVEVLLILGGNPVYDAPADLEFGAALDRVPMRAHLSLLDDETSRLCQWHLPEAHFLESWSDGRAFDGTASIVQPLIAPLYTGRSAHEVIAMLLGQGGGKGYEIVRSYWKSQHGEAGFEAFWTRSLSDGVVARSVAAPRSVRVRPDLASALAKPGPAAGDALEIVFRPDPTIFDGRFANLGWLQELPKPLSKLTWDNAVEVSPRDAARLGLVNTDVVELGLGDRKVRGAVWIAPGQADGVVAVTLGYGRSHAGRVGDGAGFDAYRLRTTAAFDQAIGVSLKKTGETYELACTQHHGSLEGRDIVRATSLDHYREHPDFAQHIGHDPKPDDTMFPPWPFDGYAWGMAVDMNACVGCNACVVACVAENNIAVVGKEQVAVGREMQWIRIDRYYLGEPEDPEVAYQPMFCQHCELAPCEVVCPVNATVHDDEGLNVMVYNRCVGTRYCSNNCPYKVRRFNFLRYTNYSDQSLELQRNPDVTVRSRGVMEKCTYCVQRINHARIAAKREDRKVKDGEIVTACQQACPTEALVFGDTNDKESRVARLKAEGRNYSVLGELNTRPRTTYLAIVRNPNPALSGGEEEPVG